MNLLNKVLDNSIIFSFDVNGFNRHAKQFENTDLDSSLNGQAALITGANSGIGFATATELMRKGCHVVMVSRNEERANIAAQSLKELAPEGSVEFRIADISNLETVAKLAGTNLPALSILIHNAGDMLENLQRTNEGHETITATHVLGPFLLTMELRKRGLIQGSEEKPTRIIFVSSGGMYSQPLHVDTLKVPDEPYDGMVHYAQTKRAQVVLAQAMHEKLKAKYIHCFSMHPGWVDTPAVRRAMPGFYRATRRILRNPDQGADTIIWLSVAPISKLKPNGGFYFDREVAPIHLLNKTQRLGDEAEKLLEYIQGATNTEL